MGDTRDDTSTHDPEAFRAKLRYWRETGGLNIDPRATPSRRNSEPPTKANPAWERGIVTERRPDGSHMPLLDERRNPIRVKQYAENRRAIEDRLRQARADQPTTRGRD